MSRETIKVGDRVNYHAVIGGPVTSTNHIIKVIDKMPNNYGSDIAWITDKSGCVALTALSLTLLNQPECKTCKDTGSIWITKGVDNEPDEAAPCPDCNQPEPSEFTNKTLKEIAAKLCKTCDIREKDENPYVRGRACFDKNYPNCT